MIDPEALVDRIYEAALLPEGWRVVLHDMGLLVDGVGASLLTRSVDAWTGFRSSPSLEIHHERFAGSPAATQSRTTERLLGMNRAGFVADHEVMSDEEYLQDPLMTTLGTPLGLHRGAATAILIPGGDAAVVQVWRKTGKPKFAPQCLARLDALRPHLARAAMLSARLRLERMRAQTQALELLGIPAGVLDSRGHVVAANDLLQSMHGHFVWLAGNGLGLTDKDADELFRDELVQARSLRKPRGRSFAARGAGADVDGVVIHIVPLKGNVPNGLR